MFHLYFFINHKSIFHILNNLIKGYSESQVKYNLEIHINAKHKGELNEDNNKKAVGTSDASNSKRNSK